MACGVNCIQCSNKKDILMHIQEIINLVLEFYSILTRSGSDIILNRATAIEYSVTFNKKKTDLQTNSVVHGYNGAKNL